MPEGKERMRQKKHLKIEWLEFSPTTMKNLLDTACPVNKKAGSLSEQITSNPDNEKPRTKCQTYSERKGTPKGMETWHTQKFGTPESSTRTAWAAGAGKVRHRPPETRLYSGPDDSLCTPTASTVCPVKLLKERDCEHGIPFCENLSD